MKPGVFRRHRPQIYIAGLIIVLLSLAVYLAEFSADEVPCVRVVRGDLVIALEANANVQLPETASLKSQMNGKLSKVHVTIGEHVKTGQLLLEFQNDKEKAELDRAQKAVALALDQYRKAAEKMKAGSSHDVSKAKTTMQTAQKQYSRASELAEKGMISEDQASDALRSLVISQRQLSSARFQAQSNRDNAREHALAESALKNARNLASKAQLKLDQTLIKSPIEGEVVFITVNSGGKILSGMPLVAISDKQKIQLEIGLDEQQMAMLPQAARVMLATRPGQEGTFLGELKRDMNEGQQKKLLLLEASQVSETISQKQQVRVSIEIERIPNALTLNATAIHDLGSHSPWVMTVTEGKSKRQPIMAGKNGNGNIEILKGLNEGDIVIPAAIPRIEEGKRIRLARN